MTRRLPDWARFLVDVGDGFFRHRCPQLAAAIAFYTLFALGPVLLIAVSIAGLIVGRDEVREELMEGLRQGLSPQAAEQVETVLKNATLPGGGIIATAIGLVTLLIAATGAFSQIKESLNIIFEATAPRGRPIWSLFKTRLVSFSMVLSIGALLLGSMILTAAIAAVGKWAAEWLPMPEGWLQAVNVAASFIAMTLMFAIMYKSLPDTVVHWHDVWLGAAVTSVLFGLGKQAISIYLARSTATSVYGAAGSVVALLLWVYYSSMIFLIGAEVAHQRAGRLKERRSQSSARAKPRRKS